MEADEWSTSASTWVARRVKSVFARLMARSLASGAGTDRLVVLLQGRRAARVILETCTEAFRIAALAQRAGHDVRVVAATLVRSLGVGIEG
jgi:hypothetical protein